MKFTRIFLICQVVILSGTIHLNAQTLDTIISGMSLNRIQRYETYIKKEINEGKIPGAVAMVSRKGKIVYNESFGYRNLEEKIAMEKEDLFSLASMTKPIISVAFMMLYEEGHFSLKDPVSMYLPKFKNLVVTLNEEKGKEGETEPLNREITIADLLTHTSGMSHGSGNSKLDQDFKSARYRKHNTVLSRVNSYLEIPLTSQPGAQFYYSAAPDVLSVLIEQFSGLSTIEFLKKKLFIPLEMYDTGYNIAPADQYRRVQLHEQNKEGKLINSATQPPMSGNTIWAGTSGLFSSASDYLKFCQMLLNNGESNGQRFLSRKTIDLMTTNQIGDLSLKTMQGHKFGLGFAVVTDVAATKVLGSEGVYFWGGAFNTHFFIDPKEKIVAVFMTQVAAFSWEYHNKLQQLVYQSLVD
ncbi:serine hydrolase domain-containing protein [Psychroflexus sp. MES1-P1E]|uniref:serine hydrolase domain-containing protein n=1 Tax=Psychroflexus sp. MES1-P1E TaxID=2058320 RepID=UPI000C7E4101|nr:serine hydrolase domain-containing protein [Psychroflexus sp. MES1-P1E]PKG44196.1 serine hydrolase [Psychroflexus sp. MES1-P1E]